MAFSKDIEDLKKMFESGVFNNHIYYMRYPKFRNLEPNSKISFDFPITFFVGKNGGGKSSTLQSLYGAPLNYSLSDYWFSTAIDPIEELKEDRNCFIYSYKKGGKIVEVLKQRAQRKNKLDYWEPSRPVKKYNMDVSSRNSPIERNVEYIDFRSELSAFDSFMYFSPFTPSTNITSRQDYLRRYSGRIKEAFDSGKEIIHFGLPKNKPVILVSKNEIEDISFILGKEYEKIEILEHKFYKNWGFSIRLSSPSLRYSEAFAGSGETAVITLVHRIHNCKKDDLVLLDEPETSLHFGAQKRLVTFLLKQIKKKHLQVIISTHSPFFLENMPSDAIKVFSTNNVGLFHIENKREPKEALVELEINNNNDKLQIVLEDKLACTIINKVLDTFGQDIKKTFNISFLPGGSSALKQRMAYILDFTQLPFLILDGDQKISEKHINLNDLPNNEIDSYKKLSDLLKKQTNAEINFFVDGGNKNNEEQKINLIKKYFNFYLQNVFYLPEAIPEDIIWDDDFAKQKINDIKGDENFDLNSIKEKDSKTWFINLSNVLYQSIEHLDTLHMEFVSKWINKKDQNFKTIYDLINHIRTIS